MNKCLSFTCALLVAAVCSPALGSIQGGPYIDDGGFTITDLLDNTVSSLTSSRTSPTASGVHVDPDTFGDWNGGNFSVLATIMENGSYLHYSYTLESSKLERLSHFTIEISDGAFDDILNPKITFSGTDGDDDFTVMPTPATDNADGSMGSLADSFADIFKFDNGAPDGTTTAVFEFDTLRLPVFGNFFAKDGLGDAMNSGLANLGGLDGAETVDLDSAISWIPVPDTNLVPGGGPDPIPEPISLLVWGGLLGVVATCRARA